MPALISRAVVRVILFLAALMAAPAGAQSTPDRPRPPRGPATSAVDARLRVMTIEGLGYERGLTLLGSHSQESMYFPVPAGATLEDGSITLLLKFASVVMGRSQFRVFVNDVPRAELARSNTEQDGGARIVIPVRTQDIEKDFVKVTLRSALMIDEDRCVDDRMGGAYVHVAPESNLTYRIAPGSIRSVRTAWGSLPQEVTVSLPGRTLTPKEFTAAYVMTRQLTMNGRNARFVRLPSLGDLAIGSLDEIGQFADLTRQPAADADLVLFRHRTPVERVGIAATARNDAATAVFFSEGWSGLTDAGGVAVYRAQVGAGGVDAMHPTLASLGFADQERTFEGRATWTIPIDVRKMPPLRVPDRLRIDIVAAPGRDSEQALLYIYLNDNLLRFFHLTGDGERHSFEVDLPKHLLSSYNEVRVVAQRPHEGEACRTGRVGYPIQILGSSTIVTEEASAEPKMFTEFMSSLPAEFPVYLPQDALVNPESVIPVLVSLGTTFWGSSRSPRLVFYDPALALRPGGPFVLFGQQPRAEMKALVRLDAGRVQLWQKGTEKVLLDMRRVSDWTVVQLAEIDGHHGLWVSPSSQGGSVPTDPVAFGNNDVVIANQSNVLLALNMNLRTLTDVRYPEARSWFQLAGRYRFWWFALGLALITASIVYLLLRTRRHDADAGR